MRDTGLIQGQKDPLEEGMATHTNILAWRIPWTGVGGWGAWHRVAKGRTQLRRLSMYIQAWRGLGFPGGSAVKNLPPMQETWV